MAYFLRQEFPNAEISTFESSLHLGGRLATVEVGGRFYETGGSIIHSANQYMTKYPRTPDCLSERRRYETG